MISGLHKFLLIILVLLQFVAPLVHAHSDHALNLEGLHVPELEIFSIHSKQPILTSTHHSFDSRHLVVSIGNGIKHKTATLIDNGSLYVPFSVAKLTLCYYEVNFSPQARPFVKNLLINSQSPRAPPIS